MSKQEADWKSYHEKQSNEKRKKIRRQLKKALKMPVLKKTQRQKVILLEVEMLHEDLLDVLIASKFKTEKEYLELINTFLDLEYRTYNYKHPLKYKVGNMDNIVLLILMHHEIIDQLPKSL